MKKTAIEVYALLICFSAMICLSINIGLVIYDAVSLVNPSLTISDYQYQNHQNNNNFWNDKLGQVNDRLVPTIFNNQPSNKPIPKRPIEDKLTKHRLYSYQSLLHSEKRSAIRGLINEFIIIFVSSILFLIHWRFVLHKK